MMNALKRILGTRSTLPYGNTLDNACNTAYLRYWDRCLGRTGLRRPPRDAWPDRTFEHTQAALDPDTAVRCARAFDRLVETDSPHVQRPKSVPFLTHLRGPLDQLDLDLGAICDGPVGDRLRERFGTEFRILWVDCYRSVSADAAAKSWLWHIDNVPVPMAKVIVYLTDDAQATGAGTALLPVDQSDRYKAAGYTGMPTESRLGDALATFGAERGIGYDPIAPTFKAGDALVFHTNTLHRGILPRVGYRDVMSLFVLPAPQPWHVYVARHGLDALQDRPGGFPALPPAP